MFSHEVPNGWLYRQKRDLAGNCQKAKKASGVNPIKSGEPPRFCPVHPRKMVSIIFAGRNRPGVQSDG
jgi:hypothetical protein